MTVAGRARGLADAALEASVIGSFSRIGFAARRALFKWDAEPPVDLTGRVAVVTGATGGIGLATAHALAARGAEVWLVGRDVARTESCRILDVLDILLQLGQFPERGCTPRSPISVGSMTRGAWPRR